MQVHAGFVYGEFTEGTGRVVGKASAYVTLVVPLVLLVAKWLG